MKYVNLIEHLKLPRKVERLRDDPISWPIIEAWLRIQWVNQWQEQVAVDRHNEQRASEYIAMADIALRIRKQVSWALNKEIDCHARLGTWYEDFHEWIDGYLVFGKWVTELPIDVTSGTKKLEWKDVKRSATSQKKSSRYIVYTQGTFLWGYAQAVEDVLAKWSKRKDVADILTSIHNHDRRIGKSSPHTFCNENPYKDWPSVDTMNLLVHDSSTLRAKQIQEIQNLLMNPSPR